MNFSIYWPIAVLLGIAIGYAFQYVYTQNRCATNEDEAAKLEDKLAMLKTDYSALESEYEKEINAHKATAASLEQRLDNIVELGRLKKQDEAKIELLKKKGDVSEASAREKTLAAQWQRVKPYLADNALDAANNAIRAYNKDVNAFLKNPKSTRKWIGQETVPKTITLLKKKKK